jgi:hypothetical protein
VVVDEVVDEELHQTIVLRSHEKQYRSEESDWISASEH